MDVKELDQKINILNTKIHNIFNDIGITYPRLLGEIEDYLFKFTEIINQFNILGSDHKGNHDNNSLFDFTEEINKSINKGKANISDFHKDNLETITSINKQINDLENININISKINEASEELQMVSLNAMIIALKAGKNGGAFPVITTKIKEIADKTIKYAVNVALSGKNTLKNFTELKILMKEINKVENQLFDEIGLSLDTSLRGLLKAMDTIVEFLNEINSISKGIKPLFLEIMEQIQYQDLIKQSIEQIKSALTKFQVEKDNQGVEILDNIAFNNQLLEIIIIIFQDVQEKVKHSGDLITEKILKVKNSISSIQTKKHTFFNRFLMDEGQKTKDDLGVLLSSSMLLVEDLISQFGSIKGLNGKLIALVENMKTGTQKIENNFNDFTKLANYYSTVKVTSRIESAKNILLTNMAETVKDLVKYIAIIEENIVEGKRNISHINEEIYIVIYHYIKNLDKENTINEQIKSTLGICTDILKDVKNKLDNLAVDFSSTTDQFLNVFNSSVDELLVINDLDDEISLIRNDLIRLKDISQTRMNKSLNKISKSEWNIKNKKLMEIINSFNIHSHKVSAGQLMGLDIEEKVGIEGEITFF